MWNQHWWKQNPFSSTWLLGLSTIKWQGTEQLDWLQPWLQLRLFRVQNTRESIAIHIPEQPAERVPSNVVHARCSCDQHAWHPSYQKNVWLDESEVVYPRHTNSHELRPHLQPDEFVFPHDHQRGFSRGHLGHADKLRQDIQIRGWDWAVYTQCARQWCVGEECQWQVRWGSTYVESVWWNSKVCGPRWGQKERCHCYLGWTMACGDSEYTQIEEEPWERRGEGKGFVLGIVDTWFVYAEG